MRDKHKMIVLWPRAKPVKNMHLRIRGLEVGEIIPFPVLKIDFEPLGTNGKML